jgi:hypothetical protein
VRARDSNGSISLLLDYKRAAQALGFTEQALRDLVCKGRGPVVTEIGRRRMFAVGDLEEFVARHRRPPPPPEASCEIPPRRRRARLPRDNQNEHSATDIVRGGQPDEDKD